MPHFARSICSPSNQFVVVITAHKIIVVMPRKRLGEHVSTACWDMEKRSRQQFTTEQNQDCEISEDIAKVVCVIEPPLHMLCHYNL